MDLEPTAVDEIKKGNRAKLYSKSQFLNEKEGSSSVYSKAYFGESRELIEKSLDKIRRITEQCDKILGF